MEQMGIDVDEIDAEEVVIRTAEEELVFDDPDVTQMDARGQQTYQVVGEPTVREPSGGDDAGADASEESGAAGANFDEDDVALVVQRTGASEELARETLEETNGDLAATVSRLE